ncbi:response regulator transcription factor [Metabacillus halosaccharovorans]|uniref:response regulator transcription factor n=1 Tax=Metabacillus halosaccharovorans TaxID=930124 RepID=UPI00204258FC|nr:response regulator transcription factor [Metabacillus halosaccharovorans]MCM3444095.1 response regulator transcription factor [Metabacillus halosaccharovorans]
MKSGELYRTLIVDDEKLIRQGIKHYINWEQEGFQVIGEASNGQEALELIEQTNPHIILTDIVMPIMDGEELTRIVKEKYPHIQIIILSSFGEFDYVRSTFQHGAVDYMLKPKLDAEGLLQVLKTAVSKIPATPESQKSKDHSISVTYLIDRLMSGYQEDLDDELVSGIFPNSTFYLMAVNVCDREEEFEQSIKEKLASFFDDVLKDVVHYCFNGEQNDIVFLMNMEKNHFTEMLEFVKAEADSEIGACFAVSNGFMDFSEIGHVYKEGIKKMLNYRFYFPDVTVLTEEEIPEESIKTSSFNLDWFTNELKHERFEIAFDYLQTYVKELSTSFTTNIFEYKSFYENMIFTITVLLNNMDYEVAELENGKFQYFNSIDEAKSAREVVELFHQFLAVVKKIVYAKSSHSSKSNMKMILEYIQEHYAEPLTLTGVANHFHFNPTYLSSYFSTNNNEGFNEYLNKVRIEEASKLLIHDTLPIAEIGGKVGYSDHSYFCKVFKKLKGVSPSQYRRKEYMK